MADAGSRAGRMRVLRWALFAPAALAAMLLVGTLIQVALTLLLPELDRALEGNGFGGRWIAGPVVVFVSALPTSSTLVFVGVKVAPERKRAVAIGLVAAISGLALFALMGYVALVVGTVGGAEGVTWETVFRAFALWLGVTVGTGLTARALVGER